MAWLYLTQTNISVKGCQPSRVFYKYISFQASYLQMATNNPCTSIGAGQPPLPVKKNGVPWDVLSPYRPTKKQVPRLAAVGKGGICRICPYSHRMLEWTSVCSTWKNCSYSLVFKYCTECIQMKTLLFFKVLVGVVFVFKNKC